MSQKTESIASINLKLPQRSRHHSETNDLMNFNTLDATDAYNENCLKLNSSAPDHSWYFNGFNDHPNYDHATDQCPILISDYSTSEQSDGDDKSSLASFKKSGNSFKFGRIKRKTPNDTSHNRPSNLLQLPKPSSLFSSSTGSIDLTSTSNQTYKRARRQSKNSIRKRKRCYSMDERRNVKNGLNSPFSFDNLAYNKENLSDISEPLSSSEKSNEELNRNKKANNYLVLDDKESNQSNNLPIIMINNQFTHGSSVRFENGDEENDKNEDEDYLIKSNDSRSSRLDVESASNESSDDLSDNKLSNEIEFTTYLASELSKPEVDSESLISFVFQVLFPLLVCGLGNLCAGLLLHKIESYEVFKEITELVISVPCLMGLKGNLEMTMASRLSTAANGNRLDRLSEIIRISKANICLLQLQATVVSLLASFIGVYSHIRENETINGDYIVLLITSNVLTANVCCTVLSGLMIGIIVFCKHHKLNPDNIACPIASSLGDVSTVFLLGYVSTFLYENIELKNSWLSPLILLIIFLITPFTLMVSLKHEETKQVLKDGWLPIIFSMAISNIAGVILDKAMKSYKEFALVQPIVNGVGGNLVAIQASRISTYLNKTCQFGHLPIKELSTIDSKVMLENGGSYLACQNSESNLIEKNCIQLNERICELKDVDLTEQTGNELIIMDNLNNNCTTVSITPTNYEKNDCFNYSTARTRKILRIRRKKIKNYVRTIFASGSIHGKCAKLLILITLPMHILYFYLIQLIENDQVFAKMPFFIVFYLMVAFAQMATLLYLSKHLVYLLWKKKCDPDCWAIPILSSTGDLLGTSFLAIVFFTLDTSIVSK